jgi:hypothetical protein
LREDWRVHPNPKTRKPLVLSSKVKTITKMIEGKYEQNDDSSTSPDSRRSKEADDEEIRNDLSFTFENIINDEELIAKIKKIRAITKKSRIPRMISKRISKESPRSIKTSTTRSVQRKENRKKITEEKARTDKLENKRRRTKRRPPTKREKINTASIYTAVDTRTTPANGRHLLKE